MRAPLPEGKEITIDNTFHDLTITHTITSSSPEGKQLYLDNIFHYSYCGIFGFCTHAHYIIVLCKSYVSLRFLITSVTISVELASSV